MIEMEGPLNAEKAKKIKVLRIVQMTNILSSLFVLFTFLVILPTMHTNLTDNVRYIMVGVFAVLLPIHLVVFEVLIRKRKKGQDKSWNTPVELTSRKW